MLPRNDANNLQVHHLEVLSQQRCHFLESRINSPLAMPDSQNHRRFLPVHQSPFWRLAQHHLPQKFLARHVRLLGRPQHSTNALVGCMLACGLEREHGYMGYLRA